MANDLALWHWPAPGLRVPEKRLTFLFGGMAGDGPVAGPIP
jgi:hypothetical protein